MKTVVSNQRTVSILLRKEMTTISLIAKKRALTAKLRENSRKEQRSNGREIRRLLIRRKKSATSSTENSTP